MRVMAGWLLLLWCGLATAQSRMTLVVIVVDQNGRPLEGANVTVYGAGGSAEVKADNAGRARFSVGPGIYEVTAKTGVLSGARNVTVESGRDAKLILVINPPPKDVPPPVSPVDEAPAPERPPAPAPVPVVPPEPSPVHRQPVQAARPSPIVDIAPGKNYATVQIYYATDRAFTGETRQASRVYGSRRGRLTRGIAHVSIPREHRLGRIESASIFRFELREDPAKHVVLLDVLPQRERDFYEKLRASVGRSRRREAFVFVHGFGNTFEDAAKRTAQIKYDLAFDGPAVVFSWPSMGSAKPTAYTADEASAEFATDDFRDFLVELGQNTGARSISVVAHSMGNRILALAFKDLPATQTPRFEHVVLTAPDIDVDVFKKLAATICKPARHVTLYVSKNDEALKISSSIHGDVPRAGDASKSILVVSGMETVDVSGVDTSFTGHSYIAENRTVLSDVYCMIRGAARAATRCRLVSRGRYWAFAGQLENVRSLAQYRCAAPNCRLTAPP